MAKRIVKKFEKQTLDIIETEIEKLAEVDGIGFVTPDSIAEKLGFAKDSDARAEAGILYVLHQLADDGHLYYPYEPLVEKCQEILGVDREVLVKAFGSIAVDKRVVIEDLNADIEEFSENHKAVYLAKFHVSETGVATRMKMLVNAPNRSERSTRKKLSIGCKNSSPSH